MLGATKQDVCQALILKSLANSISSISICTRILPVSHFVTHRDGAIASKRCAYTNSAMTTKPSFLNELQDRIQQVMQQSPAKDLEKNLRAMLNQGFSKLDLLTREEFEVQAEVLARTRAKLDALEKRVAELEAKLKS